jgi:hypothetical protein
MCWSVLLQAEGINTEKEDGVVGCVGSEWSRLKRGAC